MHEALLIPEVQPGQQGKISSLKKEEESKRCLPQEIVYRSHSAYTRQFCSVSNTQQAHQNEG